MELRYIEETSLQFGIDQHICPRSGIFNFGPYDINDVRPDKVVIGIVGISESIDKIIDWLKECESHIEGKQGKNQLPNLFMNFCGFNKEVGFKSQISYDDSYIRKIKNSEFENITKSYNSLNDRIEETVNLYLSEIKFLSKNKKPDVILCVLNEKFVKYIVEADKIMTEEDENNIFQEDNKEEKSIETNFRRLLKAKAMNFNIPIQLLRDRIANPKSDMQDAATIAWNFFTALYYKASGTPWALIRKDNALTTCYAGISFFKSRDRQSTQTSIAQIFNELGKGVILRGEEIMINKHDKSPHLTAEQAYNLMKDSLTEYYEAVKIFPNRLVIHKTSHFNVEEVEGFSKACNDLKVNQFDLVSIQPSDVKLFRFGGYPPMRGTHLRLSANKHILYTRGSVPFYGTYPGQYVPGAIEVTLAKYDESPNLICNEILALTKMNWNNTQFDRKFPITIECARNVGEILKYIREEDTMQLKYSYYM